MSAMSGKEFKDEAETVLQKAKYRVVNRISLTKGGKHDILVLHLEEI